MISIVGPVFLDTSGLIALLNADDQLHNDAIDLLRRIATDRRHITTTDWVLAETGNGLARTQARVGFARAVQTLRSESAQLVHVDASLFQEALALYDQTRDKTWDMIDCASFLIMRRDSIVDTFGTDRHFEQAGFRCLLRAKNS